MTNMVSFPGLGLELAISPVAFHLFGMPIYWYGVIIATGLLVGICIGFAKAKQFGIDEDRLSELIIIAVLVSVLCARLYYVIFYPGDYDTLGKILNIRDGGLAIYGGIIGAGLAILIYGGARKMPVLATMDITAIGLLAGQGIGRWGNFTNQEAFGCNTDLPWGMFSQSTQRYLSGVMEKLAQSGITVNPDAPVHPTFLYESVWCLLGMVLLLRYAKRRSYDGEILFIYLAWYGLERCIVEGLRTDSLMLGSVRISQLVAGLSCVLGVALWLAGKRITAQKVAQGKPVLHRQIEEAKRAAVERYQHAQLRYEQLHTTVGNDAKDEESNRTAEAADGEQ